MLTKLEFQAAATLAYSHLFKFPLTKAEIEQRLVAWPVLQQQFLPNVDLSQTQDQDLSQALQSLLSLNKVKKKDKYYLLAQGDLSWVEKRKRRQLVFQKKIKEIRPLLKLGKIMPGVEAIGITGSAAVANATAKDDVDFFVITNHASLWLSRLIILFFSLMKAKRSILGLGQKEDWCFNLWLADAGDNFSLKVDASRRSLYTAYEVSQIYWVLDKNEKRFDFLDQNQWLRKYLPNWTQVKYQQLVKGDGFDNQLKWLKAVKFINRLAYLVQASWLIKKVGIPDKDLSLKKAVLHSRQFGLDVIGDWQQLVKELVL